MNLNRKEMTLQEKTRLEVFKHMSGKYDANDTNRMMEDIDSVTKFIFADDKTDVNKSVTKS